MQRYLEKTLYLIKAMIFIFIQNDFVGSLYLLWMCYKSLLIFIYLLIFIFDKPIWYSGLLNRWFYYLMKINFRRNQFLWDWFSRGLIFTDGQILKILHRLIFTFARYVIFTSSVIIDVYQNYWSCANWIRIIRLAITHNSRP